MGETLSDGMVDANVQIPKGGKWLNGCLPRIEHYINQRWEKAVGEGSAVEEICLPRINAGYRLKPCNKSCSVKKLR